MKIGDYKLKLSVKSMCLYEQLTGKSFLESTDENLIDILYAVFVTSNNLKLTKTAFTILLEDKKVANWMLDEYTRQSDFNNQLEFYRTEPNPRDITGNADKKHKIATISEIAGTLITHGLDARYVMYDMDLWEMKMYRDAIEDDEKQRLEENRLWTYITILPHLDKKSAAKLRKPSDLLRFPWDKNKEDEVNEELERQTKSAMAFFQQQQHKDNDGQ